MFEGKYFLNRFTLVTVNVVGDVAAVEFRRSSLAVIYSAQIFAIFGEKFFLTDVCLWIINQKEEGKTSAWLLLCDVGWVSLWVSTAANVSRTMFTTSAFYASTFYVQHHLQIINIKRISIGYNECIFNYQFAAGNDCCWCSLIFRNNR